MKILIKDGVIFKEINETYLKIFNALFKASILLNKKMIITSANDSKHIKNSKHYLNQAIDVRTKHLTQSEKETLLSTLKSELGEDFDILLENELKQNEHIHIEFDPKPTKAPANQPPPEPASKK